MNYFKKLIRKLNKCIENNNKKNIKNYKLTFLKILLQIVFLKLLKITKKICLLNIQTNFSNNKKNKTN